MQTEQTMTQRMTFPAVRSNGKMGYPTNRLVSVFDDWQSLNRAINALANAGVELNAIEVLNGTAGARRLGADRPSGRFMSWLPELGPERDLLRAYRNDLQNGRLLIVVRHPRPMPRVILQQALTINGGHATHFFGRFVVHTLAP